MRKLLAIAFLLAAPVAAQLTSADFTYLGAFAMPSVQQEGEWINAYGQRGMYFDPSGDSGSGSLFVNTHDYNKSYVEIDIPVAIDTQTYTSLNEATILTNSMDYSNEWCHTSLPYLMGFEITDSYIWASCARWYNVGDTEYDNLVRWDLNSTNPVNYHAGPPKDDAGGVHPNLTGAYIFELPSAWATTNTGGNTLAVGHCRNSHGGTLGPTIFALDESNPEGAAVNVLKYRQLTGASTCANEGTCDFPGYTPCDRWRDVEWVSTTGDDAVVMFGLDCEGPTYYEDGGGWRCGECFPEILFYSPDDLADSATGVIDEWIPVPYEKWRPSTAWAAAGGGYGSGYGGAGYDAANQRLYAIERTVYNSKIVIHVWDVGAPTGSNYLLRVTKAGDGIGTLTSSPAGIDCGVDCQELYASATAVTLTATAQGNSTFDGWSGDADCSDGSVTMNSATDCTATFSLPTAEAPTCSGLDLPSYSQILDLDTGDDIVAGIENAAVGTWVRLAPGTYDISGGDRINMSKDGVIVTGASSNAEDVVLDASYGTDICIQIDASDITLAHFTLLECSEHGIQYYGPQDSPVTGLHVYDMIFQDHSAQYLKGTATGTGWPDEGLVECSSFLMTDTGRANVDPVCYTGAVDVHSGKDWIIRDNKFEGFWCATGTPDPAVHMWNGSIDTIVERNLFMDNARAIMFGGPQATPNRASDPDRYPGDDLQHTDGIIRNNFIGWNASGLSSSATGMDSAIQCWSCKRAEIYNNTMAGTFGVGASGMEIRWSESEADAVNNLLTNTMVVRDSGTWSTDTTNVESVAHGTYFVDSGTGDLHLTASATSALNAGTTGYVTDDYDGHPRANPPDVGADEYNSSASTGETLTITLNGGGDVYSSPAGVDCGVDCAEDYTLGEVVILSAVPDVDHFFRYWGGDADCVDGEVTMTTDVACTAYFIGKNFLGTTGAGVDIN